MPVTKAPSPLPSSPRQASLPSTKAHARAGRAWPAAPADRRAPACRPRWRSGRRRRRGPAGCGTAPGRHRSARCRPCVSASVSVDVVAHGRLSLPRDDGLAQAMRQHGHARARARRSRDGSRRGWPAPSAPAPGSPTPLAPDGPERLAILDQDALDLGHVADGRDQIVVQVLGAAGEVFLHQRQAEALGDAALDLALDQGRVDRLADVVGGDHAQHLHRAELDIDLDLGDLRGEGIGRVGHALAVGIERRGRRIEGALAHQRTRRRRDRSRAPRRRRAP